MLKQLRGVQGYIALPLRAWDAAVQVDSTLYSHLNTNLGVFDWTYLLLQNEDCFEVVKTGLLLGNNRVAVTRGQYYTQPTHFANGTITYIESIESITSNYTPHSLVLNFSGGIGLVNSSIIYPIPTFKNYANTEVVGNSELEIGIRTVAVCCDKSAPKPIAESDEPWRITNQDELRAIDAGDIRTTR